MEREKIGLATPLILALNGLVIAYTTGVYSEAYGNGQTIGYTTIGDPHWAEYEAKYGYTGDCEDFINQYVKEHSGEFFDIEVGNGKIHTNRITCGGDATLILIRDGVINGWYDIKLISEQRDDW